MLDSMGLSNSVSKDIHFTVIEDKKKKEANIHIWEAATKVCFLINFFYLFLYIFT